MHNADGTSESQSHNGATNNRRATTGFSYHLSRSLLSRPGILAFVGVLILVIAWPLSASLQTNRTIEQMFDPDDPTLVAYQELQQAFGGNAVVMLVYRDPELLSAAGLERAGAISARVQAIEGVRGVLSVAELNDLLALIRPAGIFRSPQSDLPPLLRDKDIVVRAFERLFTGYTHSEDDQVASVVVLLGPPDEELGHGEVIRQLEIITQSLSGEESDSPRRGSQSMPSESTQAVLVGEPVLLEQGFDLIQRDGDRLAWLTILLLSPCVLILLRSFRFVFLQIMVILWAVTVTRASLHLMSYELSLVSSILTAIVTVIAVTAVIHLGNNQRTLRRRGYSTGAAALRTFTWILPAIFWACATDAAGFISLSVSGIAPVREFGWMMAIASMAVWLAIILFAPLFTTAGSSEFWNMPVLDRWVEPRSLAALERKLRKGCLYTAVVLVRHRRIAWMVTVALAALTWIGISRLEIESSFLRNFRDSSPIVQSYQMVEAELSGAGVWDIVLDAPDELSAAYLESVRELEKKLRAVDVQGQTLTKVLSLADADRIATAVPLLRIASPTMRLSGIRAAIPAFADALLVPPDASEATANVLGSDALTEELSPQGNHRKLRIMLRSREHIPTEVKIALISEVEQIVAVHTTADAWVALFQDDQPPIAGRVTGYYVMLARIVSQLIRDQWRCLALSAVLVWLLLAAATRSLRLATIALIPNLLPVMAVLAALGLSGTKMNMGAAMIAAVSIGLSIDGSVHFMANYRRKLQRFRGRYHAVLFAQKQIGLPLLMATVALVIGFSALTTSDFIPTATFGLLTAAALVAGTLTNLTLLPSLLGGRPVRAAVAAQSTAGSGDK